MDGQNKQVWLVRETGCVSACLRDWEHEVSKGNEIKWQADWEAPGIELYLIWTLSEGLLRVPWTEGDQTSQSSRNIHWEDWWWSWSVNTLATWCKEPTHWKRPWYWERLRAGGEVGNRGWDDWMASPVQWTWVWENSGRWWRTEKTGALHFMNGKESDMIKQLNSNKFCN